MEPERGGWKTFPFVTASSLAVGMVTYGVLGNLMLYLKQQFHVDSIDATIIVSIINGAIALSPVFGAIISDFCLSCFAVISASTAATFLATLVFTLTAAVPSLSPPPCLLGTCEAPTNGQLAVLYAASSLMIIGFGGTRFVTATMGAFQFDSTDDRSTFFNWYSGILYMSVATGLVVIVYVQDNAGWIWGYGLCMTISGISLLIFLSGARHYRHPERKKNPLLGFMRITLSKENRRKNIEEASDCTVYDRLEDGATESLTQGLISRSPEQPSGHSEDLKTILGLVPLLSASIVMWISLYCQCSLTMLQALVMDRRIFGSHFSVPVASMTVFASASAGISIPLLNRAIFPLCHRITGRPPTPFQRIGSGLLLAAITMACAALVESKRLGARARALVSTDEPAESISWLLPALVLIGLADALLVPAQLEFYYQAFPESLRSSSTGVNALVGGVGAYMSTAFLALVRRFSGWLQDDVNQSRLDNVYWLLAVTGTLNFGYFLVCTKLYKNGSGVHV